MSTPTALTPQDKSREKVIATSPQLPNSPSSPPTPKWADTLLFWIDWGIKVLGVAAAVVFGIWAPLSYEAANNASASGDSAQSSILSAASVANSQASSAFNVQSSVAARQSVALDAMERRIVAIGQLWLLEFCLGNTALEACETVANVVPITSIVSYLANLTTRGTGAPTPSVSPTSMTPLPPALSPLPTSGSTKPVSRPTLSLPAILGVVFAAILFLGILAGIFVSRLKRLRNKAIQEGA